MATGSPAFTPDSLLAHEPFVRAVVRNLLKDEHRVQDVLQETWIRALHKAPGEGGTLKSWLAQVARRVALDHRRGNVRREQREREVARSEALESVDMLHARLEAQREVVDAVLGLEEPYKSVVLLCYYEQLSPQAIGARLGRSAATVRSQLSRAHEILKYKLDQRHGGERSAWAGVLWPWAFATKSKATLAAAAGIGVLLAGGGLYLAFGGSGARTTAEFANAGAVLEFPVASTEAIEPPPVLSTGEARESRSIASAPAPAQVPAAPSTTAPVSFDGLDAERLRVLAVQCMRALEQDLIVPEARWKESESELLALPDTGLARLTMRTVNGFPFDGMILPRNGGAYYSFATRSNDYDAEPDLGYEQGMFSSGFYGSPLGLVFALGDVDLKSLVADPNQPPASLDEAGRRGWGMAFATLQGLSRDQHTEFRNTVHQLDLDRPRVAKGHSYLLRLYSADEHDHLVAFRVLAKDEQGCTISWRILQRWPMKLEPRNPLRKPTFDDVPAAPAWMTALTLEERIDFLRRVRAAGKRKLLDVPAATMAANAWFLEGADDKNSFGSFRLVEPMDWRPLLGEDYAGTSWSFTDGQHAMQQDAELMHIEGQQIYAGSGRFRDGRLLDLGTLDANGLRGLLRAAPPAESKLHHVEALVREHAYLLIVREKPAADRSYLLFLADTSAGVDTWLWRQLNRSNR